MNGKSQTVPLLRKTGFMPVLCCLIALSALFVLHLAVGAKSIPLHEIVHALLHYDDHNFNQVIIRRLRLPRALIAVTVGANLSVAGALMQGVTRNPLAEPGILGLMHGAAFFVVVAMSFFGLTDTAFLPLPAAAGALLAALLVWGIALSAPGGATPLTLILSGAAVAAFLTACITAIKLIDQDTFDNLRVWLSGSLSGSRLRTLWWCLPWSIVGLGIAFAVARQISAFAMGEETATGLGVNTGHLKTLVLFAVITLTASGVALVGPLGFVGLVIPHVVRLFVGYDYRRIVPYCAVTGAIYLLAVDIVARVALRPTELSTGIVTAMLGAPLFVWLVRVKL